MYAPLKPLLSHEPKRQVEDDTPMRIGAIDFGVMPENEIEKQAHLEISDRNLYNLDAERNPTRHGPLDRRLGITTKTHLCETCGQEQRTCNGHWGYVRLEAACFHIGFLAFTIDILNQICKSCSRVLMTEADRRSHLKLLRRPNLDSFQRRKLLKKVQIECRKVRRCPRCDASNGPVRKVVGHACKLVHLQFEFFNKSTAKSKKAPPDKMQFDLSLAIFSDANQDMARHTKKAVDDLPAIKVHRLFCNIASEDCEVLGLDLNKGRPESYIWTYLPVPPPNIRPSVPGDQGTTEDELTTKLSEIIDLNTRLRTARLNEEHMSIQMDYYEKLQDHIAMYINSHAPGLNKTEYGKAIRSFCSRLKGKQGRFRGNLSGKRVNFSGRTVISPDPNLSVEEVGIPVHVAKILSFPETVTHFNIVKLREMIIRGPDRWPGVNLVKKRTGRNISMRVMQGLGLKFVENVIANLEVGDIVIRHLIDGDYVLFNRQPSLHKLSILCHRTKIQPGRTFRFNESVCNPYNADFDGDEMNIHVPQTQEARTEAMELMGVKHNLVTPKNGTPIIAPIQDFITAAYLLSSKDRFFNRAQFSQIIGWMFDATTFKDPDTGEEQSYELPPPTIHRPMYLWTGKQVFNVLMRPSKNCKVKINLEGQLREYKPDPGMPPDLSKDDAYLVIRNSEIMCGHLDKSAIGDGKKFSVFFVMLRDYGEDYAVQGMNRLAKLSSRWLSQQGFSIGIGDVYPSLDLETKKKELIDVAFAKCQALIATFKSGTLQRDPGCNEEQTFENKISKVLNQVRQDAGTVCFEELSKHNAAVIMAKSGSKGSMLNVSQMAAGVGQQMIDGRRVDNGFQDRTLPHFPKGARDPISKGFVRNSFFSGLSPTEFIFHAMSGREGLVDTAVKTAETGYMSRRLIKSLEDCFIVYDNTVRNSSGNVIQFRFGDDSLDPAELEGQGRPVNFDRTFSHALETTRDNDVPGLGPIELKQRVQEVLGRERKKFARKSLLGDILDSKDQSINAVDNDEATRRFYDDIEEFLDAKASLLATLRSKHQIKSKVAGRRSRVEDRALKEWTLKTKLTPSENEAIIDNIIKITDRTVDEFLSLCLSKQLKSVVQPGHAVGAIAAQSIGEPGTQMTLKTFHFAGVAGMSITQGVPRIKEIINAAKKISTPVITCVLENQTSEQAAQYVKGRIEKTYLRDIAVYIDDVWSKSRGCIMLRIDTDAIARLQLDLNASDIATAIHKTKGLKLTHQNIEVTEPMIRITPNEPDYSDEDDMDLDGAGSDDEEMQKAKGRRKKKVQMHFLMMQDLKRNLEQVVVKGYPNTSRTIISRSDNPNQAGVKTLALLVEGYGLKACMSTEGVNGRQTSTNSVMETCDVLGIEAARSVIISEIQTVMESMDIDNHHIHLLACIMTLKGEVLGITRFGMAKMRDSVLQLASFEKTPDHLFEAATKMKSDPISGVSESIIMGQSVKLGTGAAGVIRPLYIKDEDLAVKEPLFHTSYQRGRIGTGWESFPLSSDIQMLDAV